MRLGESARHLTTLYPLRRAHHRDGTPRAYRLFNAAVWKAIHRCLADGAFDYSDYQATTPLHRCIFSGENLYKGQTEVWYVGYTRPEEVKEVTPASEPTVGT
jgi:hypothetical protein